MTTTVRLLFLFVCIFAVYACGGGNVSTDKGQVQTAGISSANQSVQDWQAIVRRQTELSNTIVRGRILNIDVQKTYSDHHDLFVESHSEMEVFESLKGDVGQRIKFISLGGIIGDVVYSYSMSPVFAEGEDVIVFLEKQGNDLVVPLHWTAAKFVVGDNKTVMPGDLPADILIGWIKGGE